MWFLQNFGMYDSDSSDDYGGGYGGMMRGRGGGGFFGMGGDGPDRRNWAEKSQAAMDRENQAKAMVTAFLEKSKQEAPSAFPLTQQVIPASHHLTDACYKTFRKFVANKGCKVTRREATAAEKVPHKRGKQYVISITIPVHPGQLEQKKQQDKVKAEEANKKKKEREQAKQQREKEQAILRQKQQQAYDLAVQNAYNKIVGAAADDPTKTTTTKSTTTETAAAAVATGSTNSENEPPPIIVNNVKPVQMSDIVLHAQKVHDTKLVQIQLDISREKRTRERELEQEMDAKKRRLLAEASSELERIKESILQHGDANTKQPTTSSSAAVVAAVPNHK